jgi:hypothetical protein
MTHGDSIIRIFRQNMYFWHILVVWWVPLIHLKIYKAILKWVVSLEDFFIFIPGLKIAFNIFIYYMISYHLEKKSSKRFILQQEASRFLA